MKPEENFEKLTKLMSLKRHEVPPPGYFHDLPRKITARIERGERERENSLWENLFGALGRKPAFIYSFMGMISGIIVLGMVYAARVQPDQNAMRATPDQSWAVVPPSQNGDAQSRPVDLVTFPASQFSSTNPVISTDAFPSLWEGFKPQLNVQPASRSSEK